MLTRRRATAADLPAIVEMGWRFMLSLSSPIAFDAYGFEQRAYEFISSDNALIQVLVDGEQPVGMIGAFAAGHFLFGAPRMATELFWWVEPSHRGSKKASIGLLKDYHEWAREQGCEIITCSSFATDDRLPTLLKRLGYAHFETTFVLAF